MVEQQEDVKSKRAGPNREPPAYGSFLKRKNVVLVGPAGYLQGQGRGAWIDSFDVVVRVNWGEALSRDNPADYGSRTDVLYKRLLKLGHVDEMDITEYERQGMKWLAAIDVSASTMSVRYVQERLGGRIPWFLDTETRAELRMKLKTSPLIGIIAAAHLMKQPLRSLTITGFDFYATGYGENYGGSGYRKSVNRQEATIGPTHDPARNLAWLVEKRAADSRLRFDETLEQIVASGRLSERQGRFTRPGRTHTLTGEMPVQSAAKMAGVVAIIPARYESSRFPGKPLAEIGGKPMILHVCERVKQAITDVVVATDDERIRDVVQAAGFKAVMTGPALTGTDRVAQAAQQVPASIYVNVQGDEPLVEPAAIQRLVKAKRRNPAEVVGAMTALEGEDAAASRDVVKVAVHPDGRLAYCSREPIAGAKWRQLGLYAFSRGELKAYGRHGKRGGIETAEDVELLRFLQLRVPVRMVDVETPATQAVDRPEDIAKVEALMHATEAVAV